MKEILKLTSSLTLVCALAGAALAHISYTTAIPREISRIRQHGEKMALLLPKETTETYSIATSTLDDDSTVVFFVAKDAEGKPLAYCAQSSDNSGFGGEMKLLVALGLDGTIRGILVYEHSETPGLGGQVVTRTFPRSLWNVLAGRKAVSAGLPPNHYLDSYDGRRLTRVPFVFGDDDENNPATIKPVSGATISSGAVLRAVNRIREAWIDLPASVKEN